MAYQSKYYDAFREILMRVIFEIKWRGLFREFYARKPFTYIFKREGPNQFLSASYLVDWNVDTVVAAAGVLIQEDKLDSIIMAVKYVAKQIRYVRGTHRLVDWEDRTASKNLERGWGNCADLAISSAALLRAMNIPARLVEGKALDMETGEKYAHAWIEVYYNGQWLGIDPTNWGDLDKEFISESVQDLYRENYDVHSRQVDEDSDDIFYLTRRAWFDW